ncbi:hypothetical protein IEC97_28255 [Neobacillus cucumis]|uniref:hypothetical protein n=1 Tax=Neobacillus cucumis TaxID=1740721 RepID=UPI0018DF58EA|nr:hypothetical protein [Neobacillus cucumis]MBI0581211.1 hypothetical protein [Neobacillus cucumis]
MKKNYLKMVSIGFTCLLLTTSCGIEKGGSKEAQVTQHKSVKPKIAKEDSVKSLYPKLEGDNENEENYLFYNMAQKNKKVTLTFHDNYSNDLINHVTLYQDDEIASKNVRVIDTSIHDGGQFTIELQEYVESFNKIELKATNGQSFMLKTGQYSFQKINIRNTIPENERWGVEGYNTGENVASFTFDATFTREGGSPAYYKIYLPEAVTKKFKIAETHKVNGNNKQLEMTVQTNSPIKFQHQGSYEMLVVQTNDKNQQYLMNSINVAIDPDNK